MTENLTLYGALENALKKTPRADLIVFEGAKISSERLFDDISALSAFLADKFADDAVITINLPNIPNAVTAFYAANKLGKTANMVHPLLPIAGLFDIMDKTKSRVLFTFYDYYVRYETEINQKGYFVILAYISDYLPFAKNLFYSKTKEKKISDTDNLVLYMDVIARHRMRQTKTVEKCGGVYLHSGGTMGTPKTIVLADSAFNSLSKSLEYVIDNLNPFDNSCLSVLPLFHGFGLGVCVHAMLTHGFKIVLVPKFSAKGVVKNIARHKVNIVAGIPKMFEKIADVATQKPKMLKSLMHVFSGGDKLPEHTKEQFDDVMTRAGAEARIQEGYGLTECVTVCCVNSRGENLKNCMGYPLWGMQMDIVDEKNEPLPTFKAGEIAVSGQTLMDGYLGDGVDNPFFTDKNGKKWLLTGDFGEKDEKGRIYFLGRKKRLIKISGFNVFPQEIEETAGRLPFVVQAVAVESAGNAKIKLFVKIDGSISDALAEELLFEHLKKHLITYSVPKIIEIIKEFPLTAVGKIDINALGAT